MTQQPLASVPMTKDFCGLTLDDQRAEAILKEFMTAGDNWAVGRARRLGINPVDPATYPEFITMCSMYAAGLFQNRNNDNTSVDLTKIWQINKNLALAEHMMQEFEDSITESTTSSIQKTNGTNNYRL